MRLIAEFSSPHEAERVSDKFRRAGIMTVVLGKRSSNIPGFSLCALKTLVWVVLDDQYQDARVFSLDSSHKPRRPISIDEMLELECESKQGLAK
ncbi:MAG: DUF2007 domain-containing protein, partial [Cyanobacteria bacterium J06648_11]